MLQRNAGDGPGFIGVQEMSVIPFPSQTKRRLRQALLGAAAVAAIGAVAVEHPTFQPARALADTAQPAAGPASFADIVDRVKSSVVSVKVRMNEATDADSNSEQPDLPSRPAARSIASSSNSACLRAAAHRHFGGQTTAQGSGFFISGDGYIVTNNHVVDHATEVTVTMSDGKTLDAKVIGVDEKTDLALLKVKGDNYPFVSFSNKSPRVGDWVIAVGNPFGLGGTVTAGIVSARGRDIGSGPYDDFLQIDAPVNHGNSGGPTFNTERRGRRRQHRHLLALGRQRRHRLCDRQRRRQDRHRATQG